MVQMALESCHYDEDKVRATLSRVTSQWQSSRYGVSNGWLDWLVFDGSQTHMVAGFDVTPLWKKVILCGVW